MAEERRIRELNMAKQNKDDNYAEIYNAMTSDMLTENPDVANSNLGEGRKIGFLYKGMTEEEKIVFRKLQYAQIEDLKKEKEFEKRKEREFNEFSNQIQREVYIMDMELAKQKRDKEQNLAKENLTLAEEQKKRNEFYKKIVYTNRPTEEYYNQFNKSTR